jgi:hypothetical protein
MIHPAAYVFALITQGNTNELISMLREFRNRLDNSKSSDHADVYRFSHAFLTSVIGQLHNLKPGQDLHSDPMLSVWAELGYYGILRENIPENCEG